MVGVVTEAICKLWKALGDPREFARFTLRSLRRFSANSAVKSFSQQGPRIDPLAEDQDLLG